MGYHGFFGGCDGSAVQKEVSLLAKLVYKLSVGLVVIVGSGWGKNI